MKWHPRCLMNEKTYGRWSDLDAGGKIMNTGFVCTRRDNHWGMHTAHAWKDMAVVEWKEGDSESFKFNPEYPGNRALFQKPLKK